MKYVILIILTLCTLLSGAMVLLNELQNNANPIHVEEYEYIYIDDMGVVNTVVAYTKN